VQLGQHPAGFGAGGRDRLVHHLLDQRQGLAFGPDEGLGADLHVLEDDLRGAEAVDRRIVAGGDARRVLRHDEDADPLGVALAAARARGDDQVGGVGAPTATALWPFRT